MSQYVTVPTPTLDLLFFEIKKWEAEHRTSPSGLWLHPATRATLIQELYEAKLLLGGAEFTHLWGIPLVGGRPDDPEPYRFVITPYGATLGPDGVARKRLT